MLVRMEALEPIVWATALALATFGAHWAIARITLCPRDRLGAWRRARTLDPKFRRAVRDGDPSATRLAISILIALDRCHRLQDGNHIANYLTTEHHQGDWHPTSKLGRLITQATTPTPCPLSPGPPYRRSRQAR